MTVKIPEGNAFRLMIPVSIRSLRGGVATDQVLDATELDDVRVLVNGEPWSDIVIADGHAGINIPESMPLGVYDVIMQAMYRGVSLSANHYKALRIVPWNQQSNHESYSSGSAVVLPVSYCVVQVTGVHPDDGGSDEGETVHIDVDAALDAESENPVQNKVVTAALRDKADVSALENLATEDLWTAELKIGERVTQEATEEVTDPETGDVITPAQEEQTEQYVELLVLKKNGVVVTGDELKEMVSQGQLRPAKVLVSWNTEEDGTGYFYFDLEVIRLDFAAENGLCYGACYIVLRTTRCNEYFVGDFMIYTLMYHIPAQDTSNLSDEVLEEIEFYGGLPCAFFIDESEEESAEPVWELSVMSE